MELFIGDDNYCLVQIHIDIENGRKGITGTTLFVNVSDVPHDQLIKDEMIRISPCKNDIPYNCKKKNS